MESIKLLAGVRDKVRPPSTYVIVKIGLVSLEEHRLVLKVVVKLPDDMDAALVDE